MRLLLIRHAQRAPEPFQYLGDHNLGPCLTEHGQHQARQLAARFRASGEVDDCSVLLSSPMLRARQTAEILTEALPVKTCIQLPELRELDFGEASGLPAEEYKARYGELNPFAAPDRPVAPGGESWNMFTARVRVFHLRMAEQYPGQTVVAVSHGGFIWVSLVVMLGVPSSAQRAFLDPSFTGITEWEFMQDRGLWVLNRYNDIAHLKG